MFYYCPLRSNRRVDDSGGITPYQRIAELVWSIKDLQQGKLIMRQRFSLWQEGKTVPGHCFYQRSGNLSLQLPTTYLKLPLMSYKMCALSVGRLKSNTLELKQLTGVEACQCQTLVATTLLVPCWFGVALK